MLQKLTALENGVTFVFVNFSILRKRLWNRIKVVSDKLCNV